DCSDPQPLQPVLYWWYVLELGFYFSLLLTLTHDVKRKDFYGYIIHHFMTITLMCYSYSANLMRIGVLVILLHDVSDIFLEAGKMLAYAKWNKAKNIMFIIFALVFFVSRLIFFPNKVIYTSYYVFQTNNHFFFGYYFSNALLMIAQSLNIFWSFLILKLFYKLLSEGQVGTNLLLTHPSYPQPMIISKGKGEERGGVLGVEVDHGNSGLLF
ncbi:ceramide synthase 4-like, partial [Petaurus breviceps papuanus]|uniref:ceramide synthase 4-like n=1 Tax=Petaurus breviceps papuanus TaxID=3040969 RepID=UPI0036D98BF3